MSDRELQSIAPADISSGEALAKTLLALNNAHAQELSWLEPERLEHLVKEAFLARRIGNLDAFLMAFDQVLDTTARISCGSAPAIRALCMWTGPWSHHSGRGCARKLYHDLFEHAVRAGHERVVCEVNMRHPNPASDAFPCSVGICRGRHRKHP